MKKPRPKTHPDAVIDEILSIVTKHGYGIEEITLSWDSGLPNADIMRLRYSPPKQELPK